jgi:hypothetical protein
MKMMFFVLILVTIFNFYKSNKFTQSSLDLEDNLFYDETYYLKKIDLKKTKQNFSINMKNIDSMKIKNIQDYLETSLAEKINFQSEETGSCNKILDLSYLLQSISNSTLNYSERINTLENLLNDKNYLYKDENENLLIFSTCKDLFNKMCYYKFFFISKSEFKFSELILSGEKIPKLLEFSIEMKIDPESKRKYFYLWGGINSEGEHNSDLYKLEVDYFLGIIRVNKMPSQDNKYKMMGLSDTSLNILDYTKEDGQM